MSRSRFMSLPLLLPPVRWPGGRPAALAPVPAPVLERLGSPVRPDDLADPDERTGPDRQRRARIPVLRLGLTLAPGLGGVLTEAVLARVLSRNREVGTVVLDLGAGTEIEDGTCGALHALHDRLRTVGTRLRLVAASGHVRERLRESGLTHRLGSEAIHHSLRAAVLATYASLPGPGLVTGDVRAALAAPAEPLRLLPPRPLGPSRFTPRGWGAPPHVVGGLSSPGSPAGEESHPWLTLLPSDTRTRRPRNSPPPRHVAWPRTSSSSPTR